jgi:carbamoyltransferase
LHFDDAGTVMAAILGINAVFHDPAAALVVDGRVVAGAEEERFTRRKHGKPPVPFSTWELPTCAARFCLEHAGLAPADLDAVAYSYHPALATDGAGAGAAIEALLADGWEGLRTLYARRAPYFLRSALPGLDPERVCFVPHHVAHAASAYLAAPFDEACVLVVDGRGECASHLEGVARDGVLAVTASQRLPHSLGLLYEAATEHLGFQRASDEYKVMALASSGRPRFADVLRSAVRLEPEGFTVDPIDWEALVPARGREEPLREDHADLAASVQTRLEELLVAIASRLHRRCGGGSRLAMAGGVALNCVANARIAAEGPFSEIFVQPAAGDAGTALGAALYVARQLGERIEPMSTAALGRDCDEAAVASLLTGAGVPHERPPDLVAAVAGLLADDAVVGWFQGRSEFGPRALGHRSLLADPRRAENLDRLNAIKGREPFRPVAPVVLAERAAEIFEGALPSAYMLFTHRVRESWRSRIPAVVHVDGSARVQTVDAGREPLLAALLRAFGERTGVPVLVNTSFNNGGRPMVDDARDALECFASSPIDALAIGPFLLRRPSA